MTCSNKKKSSLKFRNIMILLYSLSLVGLGCAEKDSAKPSAASGASFLIDPKESVEVEFSPLDDPSGNGYNFKKILSLKLCLKDIAETKTIAKSEFKVIAGNVWSIKTTDSYGCFIWKELIQSNPLGNDKTVFMSRRIEAIGKHVGGVDFEYSVNPSQPKGKVVIYPDQRGSEDSEKSDVIYQPQGVAKNEGKNIKYDVYVNIAGVEVGSDSKIPAGKQNLPPSAYGRRTSVSDLVLNYRMIDYSQIQVDQNLNLSLPYSFYTDLSVSFLKQNSNQVAEEKLRKGNFLFHLVFMKTLSAGRSPRPEDIYAVTRFAGNPQGDLGLIREKITVNFENIPALTTSMTVLLTITSEDKPMLFADQTFEGVVYGGVAANKNLKIVMNPSETSARNVYSDFATSKSQKTMKDLNIVDNLKGDGFWPVGTARLNFTRKNKEQVTVDLEKLVRDLKDINSLTAVELESLCESIFRGNTDGDVDTEYKKCLKSPTSVLVAEVREYVSTLKEINKAGPVGQPEEFVFTSKLDVNKTAESEVGATGKMMVGVEPSVIDLGNYFADKGGISKIKYGFEGSVYTSGKAITSKKTENNIQGAKVERLSSQQILVDMDVEVQKCLMLSVKKTIRETLKDNKFSTERFICVSGVSQNRKEQYYLIQKIANTNSTSVVDANSQEANPTQLIIRGNRLYADFMSVIKSNSIVEWVLADGSKGEMSSLLAEEAPLLLSSGRQILIPDDK